MKTEGDLSIHIEILIIMCKYCNHEKETNPDLLVDDSDLMAYIGSISPILKKKHPECTGELQVCFSDETAEIPINYCPICGRKL